MIKDSQFKKIDHSHKKFLKHSNGQEVEKGYKPDYVLRYRNEYIILECEINSSRKAFVGCMVKAAHFLRNEKKGALVIVMHKKDNTTADQIANHLKPYYKMIRSTTNLSRIYVVEAKHYYIDKKCLIKDKLGFKAYAIAV